MLVRRESPCVPTRVRISSGHLNCIQYSSRLETCSSPAKDQIPSSVIYPKCLGLLQVGLVILVESVERGYVRRPTHSRHPTHRSCLFHHSATSFSLLVQDAKNYAYLVLVAACSVLSSRRKT